MNEVAIYLLGVMSGVLLVMACAIGAFCWGAKDLNEQGERGDG